MLEPSLREYLEARLDGVIAKVDALDRITDTKFSSTAQALILGKEALDARLGATDEIFKAEIRTMESRLRLLESAKSYAAGGLALAAFLIGVFGAMVLRSL